MNFYSQIPSFPASQAAIYFAPIIDATTIFLEFLKLTTAPFKINTYSDWDV
jgi:hypothetical protein